MSEPCAQVWVDGELVSAAHATVSAFDHGLVVGDGAFETLRVVDGTPFAMGRHIRRLHVTLAALAIASPDDGTLRDAMTSVVEANAVSAGRLRLTVTGGLGPLGSGAPAGPPSVIVAVGPQSSEPAPRAVTVPWTRNERGALAGLKTTSYAENVRALRYAAELGASEALMANSRGELCEGTGTNVFVAVEGRLLTPPLSAGCLAGITRELVLEVTDASEEQLPIEVLHEADEVLLTSSARDVQTLELVDDHALGPPGPLGREAAGEFAALVARNLDP